MVFKFNLQVDKSKIKKLLDNRGKLLNKNIAAVIRRDAIPHLITLIMIGYDSLGDRMEMLPEDPTNPANWREEFREQLATDLAESFSIQGNKIIFALGNKEVLGYNASGGSDPNDDTPLHWLVFYIEGLAGEWGFISTSDYIKFRSPEEGIAAFGAGGKFGVGFLISKSDFFDEGWDKDLSWSQIRHPFSSFSPLDIFNEAIQEFSFRSFIQKAIKATAEGRLL